MKIKPLKGRGWVLSEMSATSQEYLVDGYLDHKAAHTYAENI